MADSAKYGATIWLAAAVLPPEGVVPQTIDATNFDVQLFHIPQASNPSLVPVEDAICRFALDTDKAVFTTERWDNTKLIKVIARVPGGVSDGHISMRRSTDFRVMLTSKTDTGLRLHAQGRVVERS